MLRLIFVLLLLANMAYAAWAQGILASVGLAPVSQSEPARVANQIKPEAMRLLSNTDARRLEQSATIAAAKPTECLQSPLLDDQQVQALRGALDVLPAGSWQLESASTPARWIVYMGKYTDVDTLAKKKAQLRQLGIVMEPIQNSKLEPGISLGGHESQASANSELTRVNQRGVRTAKVVQESASAQGQVVRLAVVDEGLRGLLAPVRTALGAATLRACKLPT